MESRCGKSLCDLFPRDQSIDMISIAIKAKNGKKRYSSQSASRSSLLHKRQSPNDDDNRSIPYKRYRASSNYGGE